MPKLCSAHGARGRGVVTALAASPRRGFDRELSLPGPKPSSFGIIEGSLSEGKVLRAGLQQPLEEGAVLGGSGLSFVNGIWGKKKKIAALG